MKIKRLSAKAVKDTRGDKTVEVTLVTDFGKFVASAPNGKSKGAFETKSYKKSLAGDVKAVNNYFIEDIVFKKFDDLQTIENALSDRIGGNTMIAVEYVFLKALAKQKEVEVWQLINPRAKKMPMPLGNIMEGGRHSYGKKPDFQEFHVIPMTSFYMANKIIKRAHENCKRILKNIDPGFKELRSDESAWRTTLSNKQAMEVMQSIRDNMKDEFKVTIHLGLDVAASEFYKSKYNYKNEKKVRTKKDHLEFMKEVAKKFYLIEDPFEQNAFDDFAKLNKVSKGLIVGDDLVVTNLTRLRIAQKKKSVNSIIIKPNQVGSLMEVKKIVGFCKRNKIKMVFSHRSGETKENILADLAFGFGADFIKTGALGPGRDEKLNRLVEIERSLV